MQAQETDLAPRPAGRKPVVVALVAGTLAGTGLSAAAYWIAGDQLPASEWVRLGSYAHRYAGVLAAFGIAAALSVIYFALWRGAGHRAAKALAPAIVVGVLCAGAVYNASFFPEIDQREKFRIQRHSHTTLAGWIADSPDRYAGIETYRWFRDRFSGKALYSHSDIINKMAGLAPHRMAAIAGVRVEYVPDISTVTIAAMPAGVDAWEEIQAPVGGLIRVEPGLRSMQKDLCLLMLSPSEFLLVGGDAAQGCAWRHP